MEHLSAAFKEAEDKIQDAQLAILGVRHLDPESTAHKQLSLPLRFGGIGLVRTRADAAHTALISAAAVAETALRKASPNFRPFAGATAAELRNLW